MSNIVITMKTETAGKIYFFSFFRSIVIPPDNLGLYTKDIGPGFLMSVMF